MRRMFGIAALLASVIGVASLEAQQLTLVIDATSTASPYSAEVGRRRVFICRPNLPIQAIWGTDAYTDDSPICSAATHAGVITQAQGGGVTILIGAARDTFPGSKRNGIESNTWPSQRRSYTFDATQSAQLDWATSAGKLPSGFSTPFDAACPPATATTVAGVTGIYGTDVYTADSPICVASLHAGVITLAGGKVHVVSRGAQTTFAPSTRNGVTSRSYGAFDASFSISAVAQSSTTSPTPVVTATTPSTGTLAVSPVTSVGSLPAGSNATSIATKDCPLLGTLSAKSTSNTTAKLTWQVMSTRCLWASWASGEVPDGIAIARWDEADGSPCPATIDDLLKGVQAPFGMPSKYAGDSRCTVVLTEYRLGWIDDFGLEPGRTYRYRVWTEMSQVCASRTCFSQRYPPPDETSFKALTFAPTNTRPQLTELLGLKATLGEVSCDKWLPTVCFTEVTYTWRPTAAAASYMLTFDTRDPDFAKFYAGPTFTIPASPSPAYKAHAPSGGEQYLCLAIVADPNNPPNPRKGECILVQFPFP